MKTFAASILFSLIPLLGFAQAPSCSLYFETDQAILAPLQARLGKALSIGELNNPAKTWIHIFDSRTLERLAFIDFQYHDHTLEIGLIKVDQYKKSGLGEALLKLALRKYPETQVIQVKVLIEDNKAVLEEGLKQGLRMDEAIKRTPSYKIHAKFGFTDIIPESILPEKDGYGFAVRRAG